MGIQIHFVDEATPDADIAVGEIVIDELSERFEAPLLYWSRGDYETQWRQGLSRTMTGEAKSCLVTSMYDPAKANFLVWWPIYREGSTLFVQNHLVFMDQLDEPLDLRDLYRSVRTRRTQTDEGQRISEWVSHV